MFGPGQNVAEGSEFTVEQMYTPAANATVNIDLTKGNIIGITPAGSFTLGATTGSLPGSANLVGLFVIRISQPALGGAVVSFASNWSTPTGFSLSTGVGESIDLLVRLTTGGLMRVLSASSRLGYAAVAQLVASGYIDQSTANALTAAGTTRTDALQLSSQINNVTTAAASTGVVLPAAATVGIGGVVTVFNNGANAIKVYGSGSDTIDTIAGATGVTLTNAKRCQYFVTAALTYISAQLGVVSA